MLHQINIIAHVIFGTIALLIGFVLLFMRKGTSFHIKWGRVYLWAVAVVIISGLIGVIIFKRNIFLLVVTILSGYTAYSGVRTLRLNGGKLTFTDYLIPLSAIIISLGYLYYISHSSLFWSPGVTMSILGALFVVTLYDLCRHFMGQQTRLKLMMPEHIYKMVSSLSAITSAFTGTVLEAYKPYSQFLPGVIGLIYIFCAIAYFRRRRSINHQPQL